jgi:hypothetical protein
VLRPVNQARGWDARVRPKRISSFHLAQPTLPILSLRSGLSPGPLQRGRVFTQPSHVRNLPSTLHEGAHAVGDRAWLKWRHSTAFEMAHHALAVIPHPPELILHLALGNIAAGPTMQRPPLGGARTPAIGEDLAGHVLRTLRTQALGFHTTLSGRLPIMNWRIGRRIGLRPGRRSLRPFEGICLWSPALMLSRTYAGSFAIPSMPSSRPNRSAPAQRST